MTDISITVSAPTEHSINVESPSSWTVEAVLPPVVEAAVTGAGLPGPRGFTGQVGPDVWAGQHG